MSTVLLQTVADPHQTYPAPRRLRDAGAWSHANQSPLLGREGSPNCNGFVEVAKMKECR